MFTFYLRVIELYSLCGDNTSFFLRVKRTSGICFASPGWLDPSFLLTSLFTLWRMVVMLSPLKPTTVLDKA